MIVEDTQLSLAIGKKGQNVRLASKLIGWNVDIKSEEEKRQEIEAQMAALTAPGTPLSELAGVGPKTIEKLEARALPPIEKLADMTPEQLVEIPGIGEKMVEKIHQSVAAYFEALESQAVAPVEPSTEDEAAAESEAPEAAGDRSCRDRCGRRNKRKRGIVERGVVKRDVVKRSGGKSGRDTGG